MRSLQSFRWPNKPSSGVMLDPDWVDQMGIVGFWVLNEGCGGRVNDVSGAGQTGTLTTGSTAPTWASTKGGGGLRFASGGLGASNVSLANTARTCNFVNNFTVGAVFSQIGTNGGTANIGGLLTKYQSPANNTWSLRIGGRALQLAGYGSVSGGTTTLNAIQTGIASTATAAAGTSGTTTLYLDGTNVASGNAYLALSTTNTLTIGQDFVSEVSGRTLNGYVLAAFVAGRAWTQNESRDFTGNPYAGFLAPSTRRWFVGSATPSSTTGSGASALAKLTTASVTSVYVGGSGLSNAPMVASSGTSVGTVYGSGTSTAATVTSSGSGTVRSASSGASTLGYVTSSGASSQAISGSGASTVPSVMTSGWSLTSAIGLGVSTLSRVSSSGGGENTTVGSGVATLSRFYGSSSTSGPGTISGSGAATLSPLYGTSAVVVSVGGSGAATLGRVTGSTPPIFNGTVCGIPLRGVG
jgi:hypothetical protein